jgi:uncharacterized delta-60 repeat protein
MKFSSTNESLHNVSFNWAFLRIAVYNLLRLACRIRYALRRGRFMPWSEPMPQTRITLFNDVLCVCGILLCVSYSGRIDAQAGTLDPAWGANSSAGAGKVVTPIARAANVRAAALQPDGKLVMAGSCLNVNSVAEFCVARYNSDGALDVTFGSNGVAITAMSTESSVAHAVALQPDGKIILVGDCTASIPPQLIMFCVLRYNADGTLDTSFRGTGKVQTSIGNADARARAVALQNDGRIVVAGSCSRQTTNEDFCAVRYNRNGLIDTSFNDTGVVFAAFTDGQFVESAAAIAIQPDGRIVLAGSCIDGSSARFCAARYTDKGLLDTSLNGTGKLTAVFAGSTGAGATALALQADGKIVLAGNCAVSATARRFCVARYGASGALDTGFGVGGIVFAAPVGTGTFDSANAISLEANGKMFIAGECSMASPGAFFCGLQLTAAGQPDLSFNGTGTFTVRFESGGALVSESANAVAIRPDGRIVLAGSCFGIAANLNRQRMFCSVRFFGDQTLPHPGTLDESWGSGGSLGVGRVHTPTAKGSNASSVVRQTDGKILVAGTCSAQNGGENFCVARYEVSGKPDLSFNTAGSVVTVIGLADSSASAVLAQPDGRVVLVGNCVVQNSGICLARYDAFGRLDVSFNGGGLVVSSSTTPFRVETAALQSDGKIVVAGSCNIGTASVFCAARYTADGRLDTSFNGSGKITTALGDGNSAGVEAVFVQADGKIILAGHCRDQLVDRFCVARYRPTGELDFSYNQGGTLIVSRPGSNFLRGAALQADGKVILVGVCQSDTSICATRLTAAGDVDTSFNAPNDDVLIGSTSSLKILPGTASVALQADGKFVLGFSCSFDVAAFEFGMCSARFDDDGSIDRTYGVNGISVTPRRVNDRHVSTLIQPDGKIVVAGTCANSLHAQFDFCVLRYHGGPFGAQRCSLDLNGNGESSEISDMLMATRAALGMSGGAVTSDIVFSADSKRNNWPAIREFLVAQCGLNLRQ